MDYKKNYEDALEVAKELIDQHRRVVLAIFPELKDIKESGDIKKELIDVVNTVWSNDPKALSYDKKTAWINWIKKQGEEKIDVDFSNLRTWKYIVDAVLTEKEGIGQYLDSSVTEEIAKKLQERFGNIDQKPIIDIPSKELIFSIWDLGGRWKEATRGRITEKHGTQVEYIQKHWQNSDYYRKQVKESTSPTKPVGESLDDNTKAEPKFKVKDWIVTPDNKILQVTGIEGDSYVFNNGYGNCYYWTIDYCDNECHLWSFREDAKNGDIITCENGWTCIFKEWIDDETFSSYCYKDETGWVRKTGSEEYHTLRRDYIRAYNGKFSPVLGMKAALFKDEISQAGYIWDSKKKRLIER